jgi:hypothetical protein
MSNTRQHQILLFSISVSVFGLFIVLLWASNPPIVHEDFTLRKPLMGLAFSLICLFGIFAALFPEQCSQAYHFQTKRLTLPSSRIHSASHHPDCEKFSAHVIHLGSHTLCAACAGLLTGAFIALVGTVLYFFGGWHIEAADSAVFAGVAAVVIGFFQIEFRGFIRSLLNVFFVVGGFLVLVGIDELAASLPVDLFLLAFVVFWIMTRIQLSQWDHWRICNSCTSPCEIR